MYVITVVFGMIYFVLFMVSRKEKIEITDRGVIMPFNKAAFYLYKQSCVKKLAFQVNSQVKQDLIMLYPGEPKEQLITAYYVKKTGLSLEIGFVGLLFSTVAQIKEDITKTVNCKGLLLFGLSILAAVVVFLLADRDLHNTLFQRRRQMKREYVNVVHTIALYLGAGVTTRGAFQRIAEEGKDRSHTAIYDEIRYTCRELKSGVSEGAAYEHFAKRTGLQEYIRLCALLTQNLKKGNLTLLMQLKEESLKASEEQIRETRKLGEEAGTKLLIPMVLILGIVMVMIIIPAFSVMGIE